MQRAVKNSEEIRHGFERGLVLHRKALDCDESALTDEDYACVEENYWMAFNVLAESPESEHQKICASILERIALRLQGEGRPSNAEALLRRAKDFRERSGELSG